MRFALIENNIVVNIVEVATGDALDGGFELPADSPVGIGWTLVSGELTPPQAPKGGSLVIDVPLTADLQKAIDDASVGPVSGVRAEPLGGKAGASYKPVETPYPEVEPEPEDPEELELPPVDVFGPPK